MASTSRRTTISVFVCFVIVAIFFQTIVTLAKRASADELLREGGLVESLQCVFGLIAGVVFAIAAIHSSQFKGVAALFAALCVLATLREQNNADWYHRVFFFKQASWIFGLICMGIVFGFFGRRLPREIQEFIGTPAAVILTLAFLVTVGWAQVLPQSSLFDKRSDRILEEMMEAGGYLLLLLGSLEFCWSSCSNRAAQTVSVPTK